MRTIDEIQAEISEREAELTTIIARQVADIISGQLAYMTANDLSSMDAITGIGITHRRIHTRRSGHNLEVGLEVSNSTNVFAAKFACDTDLDLWQVPSGFDKAIAVLEEWQEAVAVETEQREADRAELEFEAARGQERDDPAGPVYPADPPPHDPDFDKIPNPFLDD